MQEANKSIREKGIKAKDVKNLPPIEKLCEPTTHPPIVEVHSILDFNTSDIPKCKPPDQCLDELDNFIMKQSHFNEKIQGRLHDNTLANKSLLDFQVEQLMMLNVLLSIFIWFKLSLIKFLMCKKICLLTMPNRTFTGLWYKDLGWNAHPGPSLSKGTSKEDRARFSSTGRRNF